MRIFIYDGKVINVDNDRDAEALLGDEKTVRELSKAEIKKVFGTSAHLASFENTEILDDGSVKFTLPPKKELFNQWVNNIVRTERDYLLGKCDKYMIPDFPITDEKREEWRLYRKELRELPSKLTKIVKKIPWPVPPTD